MTDTKLALITGASRGFGAALAEELAVAGWHVIAVARTTGALEELDDRARARGAQPMTLAPMDVTDPDAMRHLCRSVHDRWGALDLWVHTAIHVPPMSPTDHLDEKDWAKTIATGVTTPGLLIPFIAPLLSSGTAVFIDDDNAGKFLGAYSAAKAAQRALFGAWQAETQNTQATAKVLRFVPAPMPTATRARFYPGEDRDALTAPKSEALRLIAALG